MDMANCTRNVFVKNREEVYETMIGYEYETCSKFITFKRDKSFGLTEKGEKGNLIYR